MLEKSNEVETDPDVGSGNERSFKKGFKPLSGRKEDPLLAPWPHHSCRHRFCQDLRNALMTLIVAPSEAAMQGKSNAPPKPGSWSSCKTLRHVDFHSIKPSLPAVTGSSLGA